MDERVLKAVSRRKPIPHEANEQTALFNWAQLERCKYPELDLLYHIPNGGSRNHLEAANLKRQGVKAGVPDLCLPVARGGFHGLYIEMKAGNNKTTEKQMACRFKGAGLLYRRMLQLAGSVRIA